MYLQGRQFGVGITEVAIALGKFLLHVPYNRGIKAKAALSTGDA